MTQKPLDSFNPAEPDTWEALARYLAGESTAAEADAVRAWLDRDPSRPELLEALDRSLDGVRAAPAGLDVEAALRKTRARLDEPEVLSLTARRARAERGRTAWRTIGFRVAATVLLLIGAALAWRSLSGPSTLTRTFAAGIGKADSLRLPDGSLVVLGPDSRLILAGFGAVRELELEGEAFFDVVHDEERPFTVRAGGATIVDLGTAFAVRTGAGDVHVLVTAGSVMLNSGPAAGGVILNAGDRGVLDADGRAVAERQVVTEDDLAWTRGRLVFDDAPLARVASDLRRWYGIELEVGDVALADRRLTATFEGESADQVLEVIGLALGARIDRLGSTAILRQDREGR